MSQGYSFELVDANRKARRSHLGVALGRACIRAKVPVIAVADRFGVSRQSVYNWFKGVTNPHPNLIREIEKYIGQLG